MGVELQTIINELIDLFWHYIHSLQIMKIKKYFFITLVCIDLFWGVEYRHFFFFLLQAMIAYHMHSKHVCIICTPK